MKKEALKISLIIVIVVLIILLVLLAKVIIKKGEDIQNETNVEKETIVANEKFSVKKEVNIPKLGKGMTPIKWNGKTLVETTVDDKDWYNYSEKKWANAKTEDGSMWVWIPRYAYQITSLYHESSDSGGKINIKFLKGTTNEATDGTKTWDNKSGLNNWNIHPAFQNGTENEFKNGEWNSEISGIWVAKFEASKNSINTAKLQVLPGVERCNGVTVNTIFKNCKNYNTELNSHMMKNSEWGAVTYLSQSIYGNISEVKVNDDFNYMTGGGKGDAYVTNVGQSTTGNVYGIYDMTAGAWENVAAYVNNKTTKLQTKGDLLINEPNGWLKTVYKVGSNDIIVDNYAANSDIYGDAMYETSSFSSKVNIQQKDSVNSINTTSKSIGRLNSWYNNYSTYPFSNTPFFVRGGGCRENAHPSLFTYGLVGDRRMWL